MALLLKNGAIFLHVPKTGGMWVRNVLHACNLVKSEIGYRHDPMRDVLNGRTFKKIGLNDLLGSGRPADCADIELEKLPYTFCFVRHPLKWYESYYKFMCQLNWRKWGGEYNYQFWHPNSSLNGLKADSFNGFVSNVISKRPGYVTELFGWYTLSNISFVGKQEFLVDDLITALKNADIDFDEDFIRNFPSKNVSKNPKQRIVWDESLRMEIEKQEYASLLRYGYSASTTHGRTDA